MYSKHHLLLSLLVGAAVVPFVDAVVPQWVVIAYAGVLGVGVDLDHFVVARYNTGTWRATRECLRDPHRVFFEQDAIFEYGEVWPLERLFTHVAVSGAYVGALSAVGLDGFAIVSGVVLYVHVLSDLAWDVYRHDAFLERVRTVARPNEQTEHEAGVRGTD